MQAHVEDRRAAVTLLQVSLEPIHQAPEHERQRLELLDGPLEIERLLEPLFGYSGHQRTGVFPASQTLPVRLLTAEARGEIICGQCREIAKRSQAPMTECGDLVLDSWFLVLGPVVWVLGPVVWVLDP